MKKILSIFSIGAVLTSGGILSGGGIACGSKPTPPPKKTFNLNSIKLGDDIANLKQENNAIEINGKTTYSNVESDIISQYKKVFTDSKLTTNSFVADSLTPTTSAPWAIKITNGSVEVSNTINSDLQIEYNKPLASKTNSLSVAITTTDPNVVTKTNDSNPKKVNNVPLYFDKYIFTTKDANNDCEINKPKDKAKTNINSQKNKLLDLTSYNLLGNTNIQSVISGLDAFDLNKKVTIYNKILDQINAKFNTYMANDPNGISKVAPFDNKTIVGNMLDNMNFLYFSVSSEGVIKMHSIASGEYVAGQNAYIAIPVYNWDYLTNANYFSNNDTYVYAYLGKEGSFNLNSITLNNNDISSIESTQRTVLKPPLSITINGEETYINIENDIINQYNSVVKSYQLTNNDFIADSTTLTSTKSWALKLSNGDVEVKNTNPSDLQVWYNKGLASKTNSLNVIITTNDVNVYVSGNKKANDIKTVTIKAYFKKYIFNTQDANNDDAINIPDNSRSLDDMGLNRSQILDLSQYFNTLSSKNVAAWRNLWNDLATSVHPEHIVAIYNKIIDQVNAKFKTYMAQIPNVVNKVNHFTTSSEAQANKIDASHILFFGALGTTNHIEIKYHNDSFKAGQSVYIAIPVFNWHYLTNNNYFSNNDTYVYAYLGTFPTS